MKRLCQILCILWSLPAAAQVPFDVFLGEEVGFALLDQPVGATSLQDLQAANWQVADEAAPNFDQGENAVWAKVQIPASDADLVLALESGFFKEVIFLREGAGQDPKVVSRRYEPDGPHDHFLHHTLTIPAEQTGAVVYVGVQTPRFRILPLRLSTQTTYQKRSRGFTAFWAMFFGIILVAVIYNLWYFYWFRDLAYLAYISYVVTVALAQGIISGASGAYFYGSSEWWHTYDVLVIVPLSVFGCVWFIIRFLNLKAVLPGMYKLLLVLCVSAAGSVVVGLATNAPFTYQWVNLNSLIGVSLAAGSCFHLARKGNVRAVYFSIAWTLFLTGMTLYILKDFGVIPYSAFSVYAMPVGALMEMGLIAALLASTIRDLRISKDQVSLKLSMLEDQRRKENLNIQMAKLRSELLSNQMSPHFIFNVMSSIQVYISQNDAKASVRYLGQFAKLMRRVLESAREEVITLEEELQLIADYVELEGIRNNVPIDFQLQLPPEIESDSLFVPAMVIQPVVENAIRHGFRGLSGRTPELRIEVHSRTKGFEVVVRDNGVGLRNRNTEKDRKSLAMKIIRERSNALREQGLFDVLLALTDLRDVGQNGTLVQIHITDLRQNPPAS